jgi:hypothetical protein
MTWDGQGKRESVHSIRAFVGKELAHRAAAGDYLRRMQCYTPSVHTIKSSLGNTLRAEAAGFPKKHQQQCHHI